MTPSALERQTEANPLAIPTIEEQAFADVLTLPLIEEDEDDPDLLEGLLQVALG
jgi:hypothetical protein